MRKREQYKRLIMFFASVLIVAIQTGVFAYAWFRNYHVSAVIGRRYGYWGHWALIGLYALTVVLVSRLFSAFKVGYQRVLDVLLSQIFSVLLVNVVAYLQLALIGRWRFLQHIGPMLRVTGINLAAVILWVFFMRAVYTTIYPPHEILLIYGDSNPKSLKRKMEKRRDKYIISGMISIDQGVDRIRQEIPKYQAVMIGDIPSHERNLFLKFCFERNIRCYCQPKISDIMVMSSEKIHLFDTPLLLFRNRGLTVEQQLIKRLFDIVCSALMIVVLFPILLIIALLVKCYDGGPVLYKQPRLTKDGQVFQVYKFRSMSVDSEKNGARLAMKGDSRVTPVGKVLRNVHFDELPQLFNILRGEMSLVGPRPERPEIAAQYRKNLPEFDYRLKVKAGLTGYAQVYGKYNTTPYDKLKLDLTYIENFSFVLDLQLIATTIKILFQKENTEGVEQWQVTAAPGQRSGAADGDVREDGQRGSRLPDGSGPEEILVSVVMPAYRCADTIKQAIDSALMQEDVPLEVIVLDDQSPDELCAVMEQYREDARVRFIRNEKNLGAAATRNRGVELAKGKYIAFLDSDDWWMPEKLAKQVAVLEQTQAVLCSTGRELVTPEGKLTGRVIGMKQEITYRELLLHNFISCSSVLVRADVMREFPMEHEDSHEDYIAWLGILKKYGKAVGIDEPLLKYRLSAGGKSGNKLKSARMTYRAYRYAGFGVLSAAGLFCAYALNGVFKYSKAFLRE